MWRVKNHPSAEANADAARIDRKWKWFNINGGNYLVIFMCWYFKCSLVQKISCRCTTLSEVTYIVWVDDGEKTTLYLTDVYCIPLQLRRRKSFDFVPLSLLFVIPACVRERHQAVDSKRTSRESWSWSATSATQRAQPRRRCTERQKKREIIK